MPDHHTYFDAVMTALRSEGPFAFLMAIVAPAIRYALGADKTLRHVVISALSAVFVILAIVPGIAEWQGLDQYGQLAVAAIAGTVARDCLEWLVGLGRRVRQNPGEWPFKGDR
ncbi:MAG: hypothetical protein AAFR84_01095 [Pseudomonadota bacterium]